MTAKRILDFVRNWSLPVAMTIGLVSYFIYTGIHALDGTHHVVHQTVGILQPVLLFTMLFLSFCKIDPHDMHFCRWHLLGLLFQTCMFLLGAWITWALGSSEYRLWGEAVMIAFITPTATASVVITAKLGGNPASITTYTILVNLLVATIVPLIVPLMPMHQGLDFIPLFLEIISRIFPMLVLPLLLAWCVRRFSPRLLALLQKPKDLAFHLWAVALCIAFAVTTHTFINGRMPLLVGMGIAVISLLACAAQFALGKYLGKMEHDRISAGQALGQKNNIFAIWMAYTFFDPVSAIGGGFYMIWHNVYNSYQLWRARKYGNDILQ
ncbi:MAG: transporter [Paludibacteraceae bacterium]|nr:transporter [Paludibacteraceae bacterium]